MSSAALHIQSPFALPRAPHLQIGKIPTAGDPISSEQELLTRLRSGDSQALAEVYDTHSPIVYSVALRVLRDPAKAEDILQEVFLKLWRKPECFCANHGNLAAWLAVTARNRAIDLIRKKRTDEDVEEMQIAGRTDVGSEVETSILIARARDIIATMPQERAQALDMAFFQGMTHAEIVTSTGIPLGTVKTRIRAALSVLSKGLRNKT